MRTLLRTMRTYARHSARHSAINLFAAGVAVFCYHRLIAMKTVAQRIEYGKSRRRAVSRGAQSELHAKRRTFDPVQVLLASAAGHRENLMPIKYFRMSHSPFSFFRGAVSIMAADLGRLPHSGLTVQLCGDAHVQNLGSFAAPDGSLVFDLNDFDESIRGPWEWDVKRMAASIVLAGAASGTALAGSFLGSSHAKVQRRSAAIVVVVFIAGELTLLERRRRAFRRGSKRGARRGRHSGGSAR